MSELNFVKSLRNSEQNGAPFTARFEFRKLLYFA